MIYKPIYANDRGQVVDADSKEDKMYYIAAYNDNGDYVGNREDGRYYEKRGIVPELRDSSCKTCSIGFCESEQKWYGWSHRAIFGFGIGSTVKKGDCAYVPSSVDELYDSVIPFSDPKYGSIEKFEDSVKITYNMCELLWNEDETEAVGAIPADPEYQIIKCGKGEWTAKTLDDAKQMAIDFAEGVA